MKTKLLEKITRYLAPPTRILALLFAIFAMGATTSAWALAPRAVWIGDFGTTTKGGVTLNLNGHAFSEGVITIQNEDDNSTAGGYKGIEINFQNASTGVTVIVQYSGLAKGTYGKMLAASSINSSYDRTGIRLQTDAKLCGCWNGDGGSSGYLGSNGTPSGSIAGSGYMAFTYSTGGTYLYTDDGSASYSQAWDSSGLKSSYDTSNIVGATIGGSRQSVNGWTAAYGMKISAIAVFDGALTTAQLNSYRFPNSTYFNWWYADPARILTWTGTAGNTHTSTTTTYKLFDLSTGEDTSTTYTYGTDGAANWQYLCHTKTDYYVAPGTVLHFKDPASGTVTKDISNGFNPLTLGGLIVESSGYSFGAEDRPTVYGAGGFETWFAFDESFTDKRTGKSFFVGTVNIDVAADKIFEIKASNGATVYTSVTAVEQPVGTAGGTLKLHGAGQFKATKLTTTSGSIVDMSDLSADRGSPFIAATLEIGANTTFKFPAGVGRTYPVATSVTGETAVDHTFISGGNEYTAPLVFSSGNAVFPQVVTVSGNTSWSTLTSSATIGYYIVNVTEDASLDIDVSGISLYGITFNVYAGKTLTLTGSNAIAATSEVIVNGGTVIATPSANTLRLINTGTFKGDGTVVYSLGTSSSYVGSEKKPFDNSGWTGTVELKNCYLKEINFNHYGNANSTVRANGVYGYLAFGDTDNSIADVKTLEISGSGIQLNNALHSKRFIFNAAIVGNGPFEFGTESNNGNISQYIFKGDVTGFGGNISFSRLSSNQAMVYILPSSATSYPDFSGHTESANHGLITVMANANATIGASATWTAPGGFVINGTLNVGASSTLTGTVTGSGTGTVVYNDQVPRRDDFTNSSTWTGTVKVNGGETTAAGIATADADKFLNVNSAFAVASGTVKFNSASVLTGKVKVESGATLTVDLTSDIAGVTQPTAENPMVLLSAGPISNSGTLTFEGTTSLASGVDVNAGGGGIKLIKTSYITGLFSKWNATGQAMYAWRSEYSGDFSAATVAPVTTSSGTVGVGETIDWQRFCSAKTGAGETYTAPAPALYYDDVQYIHSEPNFTPLTLGGLLVAVGDADKSYISRNDAQLQLGDTRTSGGIETYFVLLQSFSLGDFGRNDLPDYLGTCPNTIYGAVNVELAEGVVFTLPEQGITLDAATSAQLKMSGKGKIKIEGMLNATESGVTLDYSELSANPTTPFIDGTIQVSSGTVFKFPAGAVFPYKVANSVSFSGEGTIGSFYVGGTQYTRELVFANGAAYPAKSCATYAGGGAVNWDALGWDMTYGDSSVAKYEVTVSATGAINLGTLSAAKVKFTVPSDATLRLSGTVNAFEEIEFAGGGKVVCSGADTLQSPAIKGSVTIEYPAHVLPSALAVWSDSEWRGTNVLVNCGRQQNSYYQGGDQHGAVRFDNYGSENSFIRAPGYKGDSAVTDQNKTCAATLFIDSSDVVEFNHGDGASALNTNGAGFRFAKLAGTGTLRLDGTSDTAQYIFNNVSGFAGNVEITFPSEGGRKSFLFGADDEYKITIGAYAANLVLLDDMTVAAGKEWIVPAGIIINDPATLTLTGAAEQANGAKIGALSPLSTGKLKVTAGKATLTGVTNAVITAELEIDSGATLYVVDPSITELAIPADSSANGTYSNAGMLDLTGCSAMTTLKLKLGSSTTFDWTKVTLPPSCTTIVYDIDEARRDYSGLTVPTDKTLKFQASESAAEFASGGFTFGVPSGTADANITVTHWGGDDTGVSISVSGITASFVRTSALSGLYIWHDWELNNALTDSGSGNTDLTGGGTVHYTQDGTTANYFLNLDTSRPSASGLDLSGKAAWSVAVRCQMPSVGGKVAIAFGTAADGGLALVSGTSENEVQLVKWAAGGAYSTLSRLVVEDAASKHHVYVIAVDENTDKVSFYRDGEFINEEDFSTTVNEFTLGSVSSGLGSTGLYDADAGCIDYVRLYSEKLSTAKVEALAAQNPFYSSIDTYERTVSVAADWNETDAWTVRHEGAVTGTADVPVADRHVTLTASAAAEMHVGLTADVAFKTVIFKGDGALTLSATTDSTGNKMSAETFVLRTNCTVPWDLVNFAGENTLVGVDSGKVLTFDFSDYPFDEVSGTGATTIPVVNRVGVQRDDGFAVNVNDKPSYITSVEVAYNSTRNGYDVVITPNHTNGQVNYKGGYWSGGSADFAVETTAESPASTIVLTGDKVVIPSTISGTSAYFGATLPARVAAISVEKNGFTFESGVDDTPILGGATVAVATGCTLKFGTSYHNLTLGNVVFDGPGAVEIPSGLSRTVSIAGAVSGTATLNVNGKVTIVSGGSVANTISLGENGVVELAGGSFTTISSASSGYGTILISENTDLTAVTGISGFSGAFEVNMGVRVLATEAQKTAILTGHESEYVAVKNKDNTWTIEHAMPDTVIAFASNDPNVVVNVPNDNDGVEYLYSHGKIDGVKIGTKPIKLDNFTGMTRVTPCTLSIDVTIPETIDYTGYANGYGPVLFSFNLGPNEIFVMRKSDGVMAARFNNSSGDNGTDWAHVSSDVASYANKVLELGKTYHITVRYWGVVKDADQGFAQSRGFSSAKTGTTVFVDGVEAWHHSGLRWGTLTQHVVNNKADGYIVNNVNYVGAYETQEPLADAAFHANMLFPTNIVIGAATKATRTGERVFNGLVVHSAGFLNLAGFQDKVGTETVNAALSGMTSSDALATYWYDYGVVANGASGGYSLGEQITYGTNRSANSATYSRGVIMTHTQTDPTKFTLTMGVSIPEGGSGTVCEIPMSDSTSLTVTYSGGKFSLNSTAQTETAGAGAHVLVLTYDSTYGAYLWVDTYDENGAGGTASNYTLADAAFNGKTLGDKIYFGSGAATTSGNGFFANLGVAYQNVQFGVAVCDESDVEAALDAFEFGTELQTMPLSERLKYLANVSSDGGTVSVPTITVNGKVLTGYPALSAARTMGVYTNYVTSLEMTGYNPATGNMACSVDPAFAGKMSVSLAGSTNGLVWTRVNVQTISANQTSVSLPIGANAFGNGNDYSWFKVLEEAYTNGAPVEVGRIHEMLANTPTGDGLFKYGDSGIRPQCYRIPAIASTYVPGVSAEGITSPEEAAIMALFDARYSYNDLGVPMNANGTTHYDSGVASHNNGVHHYTGIDQAGVFSLDGGETWSYPQIMIDVPNASDPKTGAMATDMTKAMELGDPCIAYDYINQKFVMMGITGGGIFKPYGDRADLVMYECSLDSVRNGTPSWTPVGSGSVLDAIQIALTAAATADNNKSVPFTPVRGADNAKVYDAGYCGILQCPGHAFVARTADATKGISVGTVIWPMQYIHTLYNERLFAAWQDSVGNWYATSTVSDSTYNPEEGSIVELDDGSWLYMGKDAVHKMGGNDATTDPISRPFYRSANHATWTSAGILPQSVRVQGSMIRLGAGTDGHSRYAAVFCTGDDTSRKTYERKNLRVFIGTDSGTGTVSWDSANPITIWDGDTGYINGGDVSFGYNSLVMLNPTTLGVLFEANGHIYFTKVDVAGALQ